MTLNVLHLLSPTAVIPAPCLKGAVAGDFIEAGLGKQQQGAAGGFLEPEFDKRGRLLRIVCFWVHGVRVPGKCAIFRRLTAGLHPAAESVRFRTCRGLRSGLILERTFV